MADMPKPEGVDFGVLIAFIAPGFVGFKALSLVSSMASDWLNLAAHQEQSFGVFLFVLLASLAVGLGISGVRALLLDWWYYRLLGAGRPAVKWREDVDMARMCAVREGFFRYFQFYGNMALAVVLLIPGYWTKLSKVQVGLLVFVVIALAASAYQSLSGYVNGLRDLKTLKERS